MYSNECTKGFISLGRLRSNPEGNKHLPLTAAGILCTVGFMNEAAEKALDSFRHEQALSIAHAKRAENYLAQFLNLVSRNTDGPGVPTGQTVRCVREWTRWLAANGPELKPIIAAKTGIKFSERGTPHTFMWTDDMADDPDDALPAHAIMRMQGPPSEGRGRPPMIYFLWSQRWDVHPLFGVGPVKSDTSEPVDLDDDNLTSWHGDLIEQLPALLSEPVETAPIVDYISLEEWQEAWEPVFDSLVAADAKPSPEVRQEMVDTLPEGTDPGTSIAMSYQAAVLRAREPKTVLGVIHPPVSSHPIDPEHGEEVSLDWDSLDT